MKLKNQEIRGTEQISADKREKHVGNAEKRVNMTYERE